MAISFFLFRFDNFSHFDEPWSAGVCVPILSGSGSFAITSTSYDVLSCEATAAEEYDWNGQYTEYRRLDTKENEGNQFLRPLHSNFIIKQRLISCRFMIQILNNKSQSN